MNEEITNTTQQSIKKKVALIIAAVAVVLIALAVGVGIYTTPANRLQRQLDLGTKYLEEQNYEQAAIAFEEAIAIDDRCMEAYTGGIEAYLGTGDIEVAQEFYDRTLTMMDSLDEDFLAEHIDYAVEINLAAEKVYEGDRDRIAQVLENGYAKTGENEEIKELLIKVYLVDANEKSANGYYDDALTVYDRLLELDNTNTETINDLYDCLNKYIDTLVEAGKYDEAIELLERGYAQTTDERLQVKIEEMTNLKAQEEAENERLLAEEEAEKQRLQAEAEEEAERQRLQAEVEEEEETPEPEQEEETPQVVEGSSTAAAYQAKAAEYIFNMQSESLSSWGEYFIDARWLKTTAEFCEYFNTPNHRVGIAIGAMNTSLLEDTENQCRIMVTEIGFNTDMGRAGLQYLEVLIDKATKQGTIVDCYLDWVAVYEFEYDSPPGSILYHDDEFDYMWSGNPKEWVIDFSE